MININIYDMPYVCRTKDLLWVHETETMFSLMIREGKSIEEIKQKIEDENIFNAASANRAGDIRKALTRRSNAVDDEFRTTFLNQSKDAQKIMCAILLMLTDRTFYEFMDLVYREKLITGNIKISDADVIGYIHDVQAKDEKACQRAVKEARWYGILRCKLLIYRYRRFIRALCSSTRAGWRKTYSRRNV